MLWTTARHRITVLPSTSIPSLGIYPRETKPNVYTEYMPILGYYSAMKKNEYCWVPEAPPVAQAYNPSYLGS
jgi:hypothetical protein